MSDFKAKMHQIRFWLGLRSRPAAGAYSTPPDILAGFKGPTSKEGRERGGEREVEGERKGERTEEGKGKEGKGGKREFVSS